MLRPIKKCRACGSERLVPFLDLGQQYLSDFRDDYDKPPKYPLVAVFCENCKLVQLRHTVPQEQMYHDRYGFKSGINEAIRADLDDVVTHAFQYVNDPETWLDIASNDGTLLSFVPDDVYRVGIDPVEPLCIEAEKHANLIINEYYHKLPLNFDVITSISCFYDMPDPAEFVGEVSEQLKEKGIWVIQQNYLLPTLLMSAVDNFCHEHLEYYTLLSLEHLLHRFDLEVNEVRTSTINGGSIRTIVSHTGTFDIDKSVYETREAEAAEGLGSLQTYKNFAESMADGLNQLKRLIYDLKAEGHSIDILAASTRGAVIWQAAEIDDKQIGVAVERNPAKVGKIFSAIGIPIVSEKAFRTYRPDYAIVGPWFFANSFIDRYADYLDNGGKLVIPLPEVKIIERTN